MSSAAACAAVKAPSTTTSTAHRGGPLFAQDFDLSQISYGEVRSMGSSAAKTVYVNFAGGQIVLQTPWMVTQFGVREPPAEYRDGKSRKFSMELNLAGGSLDHSDPSDPLSVFTAKMHEFDNKLIDDAVEHSMEWMRKKSMTREVCEALFTRGVRVARDRETQEPTDRFPPTFKVKVPFFDGEFACDLFDTRQQKVTQPIDEIITGRTQVRCLLKCVGLWFAGGKFGCSWKALAIEYRDNGGASLQGYAFRPDAAADDDDDIVEDEE